MSEREPPFRLLPKVTDRNRFFWTSGADGKLRFLRCDTCGAFVHPPAPVCPSCLGRDLHPEVVPGTAGVHTFTVNHQPWMPGPELPFVVAIVDIDGAPGVRLTTNLVGCAPDDVEIGMAVSVVFERHDDPADPEHPVFIPLFEPVDH